MALKDARFLHRSRPPSRTAVILAVLGSACLQDSTPEDGVGSAARAATAVTWTNKTTQTVSATPDPNDLTKTGSAYAWDAGAVSVQTIEYRGYVEFTTAEINKSKAAGLSNGNGGATLIDIDFAIYLRDNGTVEISEGGVNKPFGDPLSPLQYAAGDVFRVEVKNGRVTYSKNGAAPFYSSQSTPTFPLLLDTSLYTPSATIRDATMTTAPPVTWTTRVRVGSTPTSNDLTKTGSAYAWDAGAVSVDTIERRGYVEFTTAENNKSKAAGLSNGNGGPTRDDIDFAIYLRDNGTVEIWEGVVNKPFGDPLSPLQYAAGDVFRVEVANGTVTYSKNGEPPFYTSNSTPTFPLLLDTSIYTPGATLRDATMTNPPAVTWTPPLVNLSATPTSNDLTKTGSLYAWDAGAASVETIERRGYVEFTTAEIDKDKAAGLNHGDTYPNLNDIDFAIFLRSDHKFTVREGGVFKGLFGDYAAGDVFRVEVANGIVTYSRNGVPFYPLMGETQSPPTFPLLLDTSLYTPGATIRDATLTSTELHVSTQETELPTTDPPICGQSDIVTLSGKHLLQMDNPDDPTDPAISFEAFLGYTQEAVENEIQDFLDDEGATMDGFDGYLVLDIERPGPKGLYNHTDSEKNQIVDAYIRRINAARAKFPNAKIGLFQTLNPDEQGVAQNSPYDDRLAALIEAGKSGVRWQQTAQEAGGLYSNLSFLVPVLYVRYGCNVISGPCDDPEWTTLAAYTELGITGSQQLDSSLPLLPFLTVYVDNVDSAVNSWMLMDLELTDPADPFASLEATIGAQLDILAEHNVLDAALWIGNGAQYDDGTVLQAGDSDNTRTQPGWTINDYACGI